MLQLPARQEASYAPHQDTVKETARPRQEIGRVQWCGSCKHQARKQHAHAEFSRSISGRPPDGQQRGASGSSARRVSGQTSHHELREDHGHQRRRPGDDEDAGPDPVQAEVPDPGGQPEDGEGRSELPVQPDPQGEGGPLQPLQHGSVHEQDDVGVLDERRDPQVMGAGGHDRGVVGEQSHQELRPEVEQDRPARRHESAVDQGLVHGLPHPLVEAGATVLGRQGQGRRVQADRRQQHQLLDARGHAVGRHGLLSEVAEKVGDHEDAQSHGHHVQAGRDPLARDGGQDPPVRPVVRALAAVEQARGPGPPEQVDQAEDLHQDRGRRDALHTHGRQPEAAVHEPGIQGDVRHRRHDQVVAERDHVPLRVENRVDHVHLQHDGRAGQDHEHVVQADPQVLLAGSQQPEERRHGGVADGHDHGRHQQAEDESLAGDARRFAPIAGAESVAHQRRGAGGKAHAHGQHQEEDGKGQREGRQGIGGVTAGPECIHHVVQRVEQESHGGGNRQPADELGNGRRGQVVARCGARRLFGFTTAGGRLAQVGTPRKAVGTALHAVDSEMSCGSVGDSRSQGTQDGPKPPEDPRPNRRATVGRKSSPRVPASQADEGRDTASRRQEPQSDGGHGGDQGIGNLGPDVVVGLHAAGDRGDDGRVAEGRAMVAEHCAAEHRRHDDRQLVLGHAHLRRRGNGQGKEQPHGAPGGAGGEGDGRPGQEYQGGQQHRRARPRGQSRDELGRAQGSDDAAQDPGRQQDEHGTDHGSHSAGEGEGGRSQSPSLLARKEHRRRQGGRDTGQHQHEGPGVRAEGRHELVPSQGQHGSRAAQGQEEDEEGDQQHTQWNQGGGDVAAGLGLGFRCVGGRGLVHETPHGPGVKPPADGHEHHHQGEPAVEVVGHRGQEDRVGIHLTARQGVGLADHGQLKRDPGRDERHAGHSRRGRVGDVGQLDPRHAAAIGQVASHTPHHQAVGQPVEEAEQAQARRGGFHLAGPIASGPGDTQQQGAESAAGLENRGESAQDEGEDDGALLPGTSQAGREVVGEDGPGCSRRIASGQQHGAGQTTGQQAEEGMAGGDDDQQGGDGGPEAGPGRVEEAAGGGPRR